MSIELVRKIASAISGGEFDFSLGYPAISGLVKFISPVGNSVFASLGSGGVYIGNSASINQPSIVGYTNDGTASAYGLHLQAQIPIGSDSGTTPVMAFRASTVSGGSQGVIANRRLFQFEQANGVNVFAIAASGNLITNSNQNAYGLDLNNTSNIGNGIRVTNASTNAAVSLVQLNNNNGTTFSAFSDGTVVVGPNNGNAVELKVFTSNAGTSASVISIRNSSGTAANDGFKWVYGAGVLKYQDLNGVSLGQVDVTNVGAWTLGNTTTTTGRHFIQNNSNGGLCATFNNNGNSTPLGIQISLGATPNNGTQYFLVCSDSTTTRMQVLSNGGISNFSANNSNLSDARIKSNIVAAPSQLDFIKALQVRSFEYTDNPGRIVTGLIAQEVEALDPALVTNSGAEYTVDGVTFKAKSIHTDLIYHRLIKTVQELISRNETLEARLAVLEAK